MAIKKYIKKIVIGVVIGVIVTLIVWLLGISDSGEKTNVTVTSSNVAIGNTAPVTQILNQNPFPAPSFSYSVSFLNNNKDFGIPPTPKGQFKSAFGIMIVHAPATHITGTLQWRNVFSSCLLGNDNWSQQVNNNGMLNTVNQFVCFSKHPVQDDGNLFQYSP